MAIVQQKIQIVAQEFPAEAGSIGIAKAIPFLVYLGKIYLVRRAILWLDFIIIQLRVFRYNQFAYNGIKGSENLTLALSKARPDDLVERRGANSRNRPFYCVPNKS